MEGINIKRNPNEGKILKEPRLNVIQAVIDAFLNGEQYRSSKVFGAKSCVDTEAKKFDGDGYKANCVHPYAEEMQKAFDILTENGYYVFKKAELHRELVEIDYYVSQFKDGAKDGFKPTTTFTEAHYI